MKSRFQIMREIFTVPAIHLLFFLLSSPVYCDIIISASKNEFPATYLKAGKWHGMDIELLGQLMTRANRDYQIVYQPFPRTLLNIQNGSVHIAPNLVKNKERSVYMNWIGPVRVTCIGLVVKKDDQNLHVTTTEELINTAKLKNKKLGYLSGASYSPSFDHRLVNDTDLAEILHFLPDNAQHRKMLKLGRLLGYFQDAFEVRQRLLDEEFASHYEGLALHPYRIEDSCTGAYFGVSKKLDREIYNGLEAAFQAMKDDGSFVEIHQKWVGVDP